MKFLLDAHLPQRLARALGKAGHDVLHTSELPEGNATSDIAVCEVADAQGRIVVTKDRDFRDSHLLRGSPGRLLVIRTGNTSNADLLDLVDRHLADIEAAFEASSYVEMTSTALVVHQRR